MIQWKLFPLDNDSFGLHISIKSLRIDDVSTPIISKIMLFFLNKSLEAVAHMWDSNRFEKAEIMMKTLRYSVN